MDILMAISAQVFPVAPVRRIIQMIAVFVVDRYQLSLGRGEFPAASGTDQAVQGQRSVPVILFGGQTGPDFLDDFSNRFISGLTGFWFPPGTPAGSEGHSGHKEVPFF
jgi:hypothetical protein